MDTINTIKTVRLESISLDIKLGFLSCIEETYFNETVSYSEKIKEHKGRRFITGVAHDSSVISQIMEDCWFFSDKIKEKIKEQVLFQLTCYMRNEKWMKETLYCIDIDIDDYRMELENE
jgi:hypothetical protein